MPSRRKNINNRNRRRNGSKHTNNASGLLKLTKISATPQQKRSMRYEVSGNGSFIFTATFLKRLALFGIQSSTTGYTLFEGIRLDAVSLTILPSSSTNVGTLVFRWLGDRTSPETETLVYAPAIPSKYTFYPPNQSLASFWYTE